MKNLYFQKARAFLFFCILFLSFNGIAQVGINTTNPRTTLEVAGDVNIDGAINVDVINAIQDGEEGYLLTQTQTNFIKELSSAGQGNALAYFQTYELQNMQSDWVADFNTNVDATKYGMIIISASFNNGLEMDANNNFAIPAVSTFVNDATWRIRADYPDAQRPDDQGSGDSIWTITTLVITKNISKELPPQTVLMGGATSGTATTPIID